MSRSRKLVIIDIMIFFCLIGLLFCIPRTEEALKLKTSYYKLCMAPSVYGHSLYTAMDTTRIPAEVYFFEENEFYDKNEMAFKYWRRDFKGENGTSKLRVQDIYFFDENGYLDHTEVKIVDRIKGHKARITFHEDGSKDEESYVSDDGRKVKMKMGQGLVYGIENVGVHLHADAELFQRYW